jgi:predicted regulator of Ras-like GTPase activity (Roadblock/LC7/MglB family)
VSGTALTPELALDYLGELTTDIRAAVIVDRAGKVAAASGDPERGERMGSLAGELLDAAAAATPDDGIDQVEVVSSDGSVFAVRGDSWTVAVVAGSLPLSSLMFYDLRSVLRDLGGAE